MLEVSHAIRLLLIINDLRFDSYKKEKSVASLLMLRSFLLIQCFSSAYGIRTRVPGVRGRYPRPLDESAIVAKKFFLSLCGSWGIRTPGTVTRTAV